MVRTFESLEYRIFKDCVIYVKKITARACSGYNSSITRVSHEYHFGEGLGLLRLGNVCSGAVVELGVSPEASPSVLILVGYRRYANTSSNTLRLLLSSGIGISLLYDSFRLETNSLDPFG